ncbi:hypothetical protein ACHAWF_004501 [Thalassiosira exigua]
MRPTMASNPRRAKSAAALIPAISSGFILLAEASRHDDRLVGPPPPHLRDGLVAIAAFLRRHRLLSSSAASANGNGVNGNGWADPVLSRIYGPAIAEFARDQLDRQAAGLRTNTESASAAELQRLVERHADALQHGLDSIAARECDESGILSVHARLCPNANMAAEAGRYREIAVRSASVAFPRAREVPGEMGRFVEAVARLENRIGGGFPTASIADEARWVEQIQGRIGLVAVVLFGIIDIHPFRVSERFLCRCWNKGVIGE